MRKAQDMKKGIKVVIVISAVIVTAVAAFLFRYGDMLGINIIKPSPEKYVKQALMFMDSQGIYASGDEWEKTRAQTLEKAKDAESYEECHQLINNALKVAGGKHSGLITADESNADEFILPTVEIKSDGVIYIKLPQYSGTTDEGLKYATAVYDVLRENNGSIKAAVVDLRGNHGGDMGPMVAAVSPLLPNGELMHFDIQGTKRAITLENGSVNGGGSTVTMEDSFKLDVPIAVLQDDETGSSAEALLICFMGLDNVRRFGGSSAGYCSCNTTRKLYDGATILLTIGKDVARTGEQFCEDPIEPEVSTDAPLETALEWLTVI